MDNETLESNKILLEGERARRLRDNDDWKWAKGQLTNMIAAVMSIETITEYKTATSLQQEIAARKKAAGLVKAWIEEVEGSGIQQQYNTQEKIINNELMTRFEE